MLRRTKIVATLGPATDRSGELERVIKNGMDVARVNFSHGESEEHLRRVQLVREIAEANDRHAGVMVDLQGPKIRIEGFKQGGITLSDGARFTLDPDLDSDEGTQDRVGVTHKNLAEDLDGDDILLLDDGNIVMQVDQVSDNQIHCRVLNGGRLTGFKGLNRLGGGLSADALTEKDHADIRTAAQARADYLAVSFVRSGDDVVQARDLFQAAGGDGGIIAKIERAEAIENVDDIIEAADGVMIARGDLGVEIGDAELPGIQKRFIRQARESNRVVITATQMMQSMIDSPQPTRAEVLDVANAVMDGTDAVMLSAETAVGRHPAKVIKAMDRICRGAERHRVAFNHRVEARFETAEESIAMAAMYTANHAQVAAIVAMTESGATAKWMSRNSSGIPIFAMSPNVATVRRVSLYRGVYPILVEAESMGTDAAEQQAICELRQLGIVNKDDSIVVTKGDLTGITGGTNSLKIIKV
jgi:pyruvate kinase